jgi:ERCC4-type nuclease
MPPLPKNTQLPTIVVDTREQTPLVFTRLASVAGTLQSGDYSFVGGEETFAIERKGIDDLVSCCMGCNRERFQRELHRLRGFRFKRLLIVGSRDEIENGGYRSKIKPLSVLATLAAVETRYDIPVVFSGLEALAAMLVESWAAWYARELINTTKETLKK